MYSQCGGVDVEFVPQNGHLLLGLGLVDLQLALELLDPQAGLG